MASMKEFYQKECVPLLMKEFGYKNTMQLPKLVKVVLNMGLGEAIQNAKALESATEELSLIAGQRPVITKARKSIASFKLREGMSIGCMVTLRGDRMYDFLANLLHVGLPRVRDFRGVSEKSFDGRGNYTLGIKEQIIFQEIDYNKVEKIRGLNVTIVTSAQTDAESRYLLKLLGMPFRS